MKHVPPKLSATNSRLAQKIFKLSQLIVRAQAPIRVLDAVKWDNRVDEFLLKTSFKRIPSWGTEDYKRINLGFIPKYKIREFANIMQTIDRTLGKRDRVGNLLKKNCQEYSDVCLMLEGRGKKQFGQISKKLYGSAHSTFMDKKCTVKDLGISLKNILSQLDLRFFAEKEDVKKFSAFSAARILNQRFKKYFHRHLIIAEVSDQIIADAAAGNKRVLLKSTTPFSARDIDILEVHEGWVHVGTTLNGMRQKYARWLSKGPPRVVSTQEGLAVMMEIFSFRSTPSRMRRINDRLYGIYMVEEGATLVELARYYQDQGYEKEDILYNLRRIFRGATWTGGFPFTKDIAYAKGFVENYNFIRTAMAKGLPELIPFLFVGKINVGDIPLIYQLHCEGIVSKPYYLPPLFADLNGLSVWMSFSNFLNSLHLSTIHSHYEKLFSMITGHAPNPA